MMKFSDLKPGRHIVEYRDGRRRLVLSESNEDMVFAGTDGVMAVTVGEYTQDFKRIYDSGLDVVKVYEIEEVCTLLRMLNDLKGLKLVWKDEVKVNMTVEEIEQKLGLEAGQLNVISGINR